jgi:8-oxo-dGTP pyrophosphatase MutT (NUDIX family)
MPIPEFIVDLRARIGNHPLWLPGVSAVVTDDDGRLLLGRRADNGRWAVISGIPEPGEEAAAAALREVLEETGVVARVVALTAVTTSERITYPNGDVAQYLDVCFWCLATGGEATVADDESLEVGWFRADALPTPLNQSSIGRIEHTLAYARKARTGGTPKAWFADGTQPGN